jgi:plasmid stabilization system protein ParE
MGEVKEETQLEIMSTEDRWTVIISTNAEREISEIGAYIEEVTLEPDIADKQIARIKKAIESLDFMPYCHRLHDNERLRSQGVRRMLVDNYIVFYKPDEAKRCVKISHVIHNKRNIENIIDKVLDKPEQTEE